MNNAQLKLTLVYHIPIIWNVLETPHQILLIRAS